MNHIRGGRGIASAVLVVACLLAGPFAAAVTVDHEPARFDHLIRQRGGGAIGSVGKAVSELPASDAVRRGWQDLAERKGGPFKAWLDERSGLPTLVLGKDPGWLPPGNPAALDRSTALAGIDARARTFIGEEPELLGAWNGELVVDDDASGMIGNRVWQLTLRQEVDGVPVEGARYDFHVSGGNLVSFGATALTRVTTSTSPTLSIDEARNELRDYLDVQDLTLQIDGLEQATLHLVTVDPRGMSNLAWDGVRGQGYGHRLVWRFRFTVPDELAMWVAEIDAHSGAIVSLFDDARYERIKGGIFPVANDGDCPSGGCHEADFPMPFLNYSENGGPGQFTEDHGVYACQTLGQSIVTTLDGEFVDVIDDCGASLESTTCENELDLGVGLGTDCSVGAGSSAGNTRSGRTTYYHMNVAAQRVRAYLPANTWLQNTVGGRVNINENCNAVWGGNRVNMFRQGSGCRNTGESPSIVAHEWGHGMDQNDGGGFDSPSEGYADIVGFLHTRESCMGRGFRLSGNNCGSYGDSCLDCNGIRDLDWDKRQNHTPATPGGFVAASCGGGGGSPCGGASHCEGIMGAETIWDLATRDLPATGMDQETAWQLVDRLWFQSRAGSGGSAYNCSGNNGDSCGTNSWYHKLRVADDDDGDLTNGTPHAEAIFAAFDRHEISCGNSNAAENTSTSSCPTLAQPVVTDAKGLSNAVSLTWNPVTDAGSYLIFRNDMGCNSSNVLVGEVLDPTATFVDDDLVDFFTVYYRVQAVGANSACESALSDCVSVAPEPLAGVVRFDRASYGCDNRIGLRVRDSNIVGPTVTIDVRSNTETTPEPVVLTESFPGSITYLGEIFTTATAPASDGLLSIVDGGGLAAEYVDADDGDGNFNVMRDHTAVGDCVFPMISGVQTQNVTVSSANVSWSTDETTDTVVLFGETTPPGATAVGDPLTLSHSVALTGLDSCTVYFYEAQSTDPAGNFVTDDNGGAFFQFETLGDLGNGVQQCHLGRVAIDQPTPSCSQTVTFDISDIDLNNDPGVAETVTVLVTTTTESTPEIVLLTETGVDTSLFSGSIATAPGAPAADGLLQSSHGDVLTVTYSDADDGAGAPTLGFDTASLDCAGPQITDLRVETHTDARVRVRWTTEEPSTSVLEWGATAALGQMESSSDLVTDHVVALNQFFACEEAHFRVSSTDAFTNTAMVDNVGSPFLTRTHEIPGLYWKDDFESGNNGWTLGGEWEIGAPGGLGGSSGAPDPSDAYNNGGVLGHDLTGLGSFPGDYEPSTSESADSPTQNASSWTNTKLIVHRRLNSGSGDQARLVMKFGAFGTAQLITTTDPVSDGDYVVESFDVSTSADGQSSVFVRFTEISDGSGSFGGWNVDDVIFKDGSLPDYAACGNCGTAPAFAGVVSAVDNNACGATGVTVSWNEALSWGTGGSGVYHVHRDTTPGFIPSGSNVIVEDLTGLSYNDTSAPTDQAVYYAVVAENDEPCVGGGPNADGLTSGESVIVAVAETTTVATPGAVPSLTVNTVSGAHVRLQWTAAIDATAYRVFRSTSPQPGTFTLVTETDDLLFEDLGEGITPDSYYYKVVGINACGQEGP